jgi:hypothetical protein
MQFRRLRWHSRRRQDVLFERLDRELQRWLGAWSVEPNWLNLNPISLDMYKTATPLKWLRVSSEKGELLMGAPETQLNNLGGMLAKASSDDVLHLGKRIGDRALKALASSWHGVAVTALDIETCKPPSNEIFLPQFGYSAFSLKGSGFSAFLIFDANLIDSLVPSTSSDYASLESRESALVNETIMLNVSLSLGDTTLADTVGMQVGDVLMSSTSIHSIFNLVHPGQRHLANVRLVRNGNQQAVLIDAP